MAVQAERARLRANQEAKVSSAIRDVMLRIPDAISFADTEAEASGIAKSPEGKFVLTYLLATRNVLKPVLSDLHAVNPELLQPLGGREYNPERTIDMVGISVAHTLAENSTNLHNTWIRTEEQARWRPVKPAEDSWEHAERFIFVDPLDETSAIPKGNRVQSTGLAVYDRNGTLLTMGVMSLVDDAMMFIDHTRGSQPERPVRQAEAMPDPIRIATLTRRMYKMRDLPLFTSGEAVLAAESIGGYVVLSMMQEKIDAMIDPVKGNPWYEYIIWGPAAEALGFVVTDAEGKPIDRAEIVRRGIEKNPGDNYRVPFVISRTPEIHKKILTLLKKPAEDKTP